MNKSSLFKDRNWDCAYASHRKALGTALTRPIEKHCCFDTKSINSGVVFPLRVVDFRSGLLCRSLYQQQGQTRKRA